MLPKYLKVKNALLEKLKQGEFEPGDQFYSESELVKMYNVSSITVIRALKELVLEGYLFSIQGKGRFVSKGKLGQVVRFTDVEKFPDHDTSIEIISITESDDSEIRKRLKLSKNKTLYRFERLRKSDGVPFFLQYSYISSDYIRKEDLAFPERFDSIYDKMRRDYGFHLSEAPSVEYYKIVYPTPKRVAELLQIEETSPVSFVERTTYLEDETVFEYIQSYKRWDYYCSKIEAT